MSVPNKCRCEICGLTDNRRPHHALTLTADRATAPARRADFPRRNAGKGNQLASQTRRARDRADLRSRLAEGI